MYAKTMCCIPETRGGWCDVSIKLKKLFERPSDKSSAIVLQSSGCNDVYIL